MAFVKDRDEPIYTISIAAKLVRPLARTTNGGGEAAKPIHAQTLRMYDRLGLVKPRKVGKNRFYSDRDIERLQQIQHLTQDIKVNLSGVAYIISLLDQMGRMEMLGERLEAMLREAEQQAGQIEQKRTTTKTENEIENEIDIDEEE
jgi:MerR family transcriptional regulator/heat shock protein HspR